MPDGAGLGHFGERAGAGLRLAIGQRLQHGHQVLCHAARQPQGLSGALAIDERQLEGATIERGLGLDERLRIEFVQHVSPPMAKTDMMKASGCRHKGARRAGPRRGGASPLAGGSELKTAASATMPIRYRCAARAAPTATRQQARLIPPVRRARKTTRFAAARTSSTANSAILHNSAVP